MGGNSGMPVGGGWGAPMTQSAISSGMTPQGSGQQLEGFGGGPEAAGGWNSQQPTQYPNNGWGGNGWQQYGGYQQPYMRPQGFYGSQGQEMSSPLGGAIGTRYSPYQQTSLGTQYGAPRGKG